MITQNPSYYMYYNIFKKKLHLFSRLGKQVQLTLIEQQVNFTICARKVRQVYISYSPAVSAYCLFFESPFSFSHFLSRENQSASAHQI